MATTAPLLERTVTAREIMQTRVVAAAPELTIRALVQLLSDNGVSGVPVLTPTGRIVGVVSTTDVVRFLAHEAEIPAGQLSWAPGLLSEEEVGPDGETPYYFLAPEAAERFSAPAFDAEAAAGLDAYTVAEIMTPVAFTVGPAAPVRELVQLFLRGRIHRVLVVEKGILLGIVTPFDILRWVADEAPATFQVEGA